jgi:hypothetical protein
MGTVPIPAPKWGQSPSQTGTHVMIDGGMQLGVRQAAHVSEAVTFQWWFD